jgi:hypothetical protein
MHDPDSDMIDTELIGKAIESKIVLSDVATVASHSIDRPLRCWL